MSDKPKSPQFQFTSNVPATLTPEKVLKEGDSKYGHWIMWKVDVEGVEHVLFADDTLHEILANHHGMTVTVVREEHPAANGKKRLEYAIVRPTTAPTPPPPSRDRGQGEIAPPASVQRVLLPENRGDTLTIARERSIEAQVALKVAGEIVAARTDLKNPAASLKVLFSAGYALLESVLRPVQARQEDPDGPPPPSDDLEQEPGEPLPF